MHSPATSRGLVSAYLCGVDRCIQIVPHLLCQLCYCSRSARRFAYVELHIPLPTAPRGEHVPPPRWQLGAATLKPWCFYENGSKTQSSAGPARTDRGASVARPWTWQLLQIICEIRKWAGNFEPKSVSVFPRQNVRCS